MIIEEPLLKLIDTHNLITPTFEAEAGVLLVEIFKTANLWPPGPIPGGRS